MSEAVEETRPAGPAHLLSFDVEEYFQVEAAYRGGVRAEQWESYPRRLDPAMDCLLGLLDEGDVRATFFFLGWAAKDQSHWVRLVAEQGHEVASHGMSHNMVHRLSPNAFRQELLDSKHLLEDLSGQSVEGFRAPTFSVTASTFWALDILAETGYRYDSSIFPVRHDRYGVPFAPRWTHRAIGPGGGEVLEIPPLTMSAMGSNWPVGGGGYLRLFPLALLGRGLRQAEEAAQPGMIYLHPWEFDPGQPILPMGRVTRWRHRVNLHRTAGKVRRLIRRFRFGTVRDYLRSSPSVDRTFAYHGPESAQEAV